MKVYRCTNESCSLGSRVSPGTFTGGMSAELRNLLTAEPVEAMVKGEHYGPGVCPNCGELGEEYNPRLERLASLDDQISALQAQRREVAG